MAILDKILGGNTLYYPGCLSKFVALDLLENYRLIFKKIGLDFIELKELEVCCGSPVLKAGFVDDFKNLAEKNSKLFKEHSVKKIISHCPACVFMFKEEYKKILGEKWDIRIEHAVEAIVASDWFKKAKSKKSEGLVCTYHDPCHLGKELGIFKEPREIIVKCGYEIKEMLLSKENSFCCGGGGGVRVVDLNLAKKVGEERVDQAKETGVDLLVTACPMCYSQLKEAARGIRVKEISEIILENLL